MMNRAVYEIDSTGSDSLVQIDPVHQAGSIFTLSGDSSRLSWSWLRVCCMVIMYLNKSEGCSIQQIIQYLKEIRNDFESKTGLILNDKDILFTLKEGVAYKELSCIQMESSGLKNYESPVLDSKNRFFVTPIGIMNTLEILNAQEVLANANMSLVLARIGQRCVKACIRIIESNSFKDKNILHDISNAADLYRLMRRLKHYPLLWNELRQEFVIIQ